jgi:RNA polymerase sigma-70 factor (ECF subfamily)
MTDGATMKAAPKPPPLGDEELLARARAGERAAFQLLYHRYVDGVFRRLTHLLGPDPEREDVVQQVFADLFRGLHRFRGEARFSTYVYRITANIACDHLRRRYRRRETLVPGADGAERGLSPGPTPEALAIRRQDLDQAWNLLDRVKPKKRVAYLLRVVEGLTLEEIAEQVGARPMAVAQRIRHAQRELLKMIEKKGKGQSR